MQRVDAKGRHISCVGLRCLMKHESGTYNGVVAAPLCKTGGPKQGEGGGGSLCDHSEGPAGRGQLLLASQGGCCLLYSESGESPANES